MTELQRPDEALDVMRLLSHLYLQYGRADSALTLLRALCLLAPDDRRAMRALACAAIRAGQPQEGERVIDVLRDAGDPSPIVHLLHGQALAAMGRRGEAEHAFAEFARRRFPPARAARRPQ
jgi:predicted Zn-dependent protease